MIILYKLFDDTPTPHPHYIHTKILRTPLNWCTIYLVRFACRFRMKHIAVTMVNGNHLFRIKRSNKVI